ncbi:MAG: hypothetical protein H0W10_06400, partial [Chloroflexi bacterium]|nr:hypothetical protein [Chloroflexota bacterium]
MIDLEQALREMARTAVYRPMPDPTDAVLRAITEAEGRRRGGIGRLALRPLVLAMLLTLLVAGIAAAVYFIATTWLSSGPRGIQYSNEFSFSEVWRDDGPFYSDFALDADGASVYALRQADPQQPQAVLSRLTGLQGGEVAATDLLQTDDLLDPALWDPGADLTSTRVGSWYLNAERRMSVAPDGGVFLLLGAWSEADSTTLQAAAIVRWAPGGSAQRVLGADELPALVEADSFGAPPRVSIAASAPDRLWISLIGQASNEGWGRPVLATVTDPNADGNWSDRRVEVLTLPAIPPFEPDPDGVVRWDPLALVAEPSAGGVDRSGSVLYPALSFDGTYRVARVSVGGEAEVIFEQEVGRHDGPEPALAPRLVVDGGEVALRELVAGSLTRTTRVSRIAEDGTVTDIARSIDFGPQAIVPDRLGNIFVVVQ